MDSESMGMNEGCSIVILPNFMDVEDRAMHHQMHSRWQKFGGQQAFGQVLNSVGAIEA